MTKNKKGKVPDKNGVPDRNKILFFGEIPDKGATVYALPKETAEIVSRLEPGEPGGEVFGEIRNDPQGNKWAKLDGKDGWVLAHRGSVVLIDLKELW